ncbi:MAG: single-stranded DNA-binding protein [Actinobacteria bacterium]|nr:single-stranded DNA-binding protein [Actinomycetota bacterium]
MDTKNVVVLVGRLAADPELRYLPNATPVANFAVAVNRSSRKADGSFEDSLDGFFDCELFGGQALALAENAGKGTEVHLTGSLLQKKFQTKGAQSRTISKIEIRVSTVAPALPAAKETPATEQAPAPQPA